jgi:hypothetical protein
VRDFCDEILAFIGSESLTDEEFDSIESTSQTLTQQLFQELYAILILRESITDTKMRLYQYFVAGGVDLSEPQSGKSNILLGAGLED